MNGARGPVFVTVIAVGVLLSAPTIASAFPIRTTDPNVGVFSGYAALARVEAIEASNSQMDVSAFVVPAAILYSPTTYSAFGVVVPYVQKRLKIRGQGEEFTRGLSDVQLFGRYKLFSRPALRAWNQASFQLTLKAPTGSTERGTRIDLPPVMKRKLQPTNEDDSKSDRDCHVSRVRLASGRGAPARLDPSGHGNGEDGGRGTYRRRDQRWKDDLDPDEREDSLLDKEGAPADRSSLREGDRVVVDVTSVGGSTIAEEIRFAHPEGEAADQEGDGHHHAH